MRGDADNSKNGMQGDEDNSKWWDNKQGGEDNSKLGNTKAKGHRQLQGVGGADNS